MVNEIVHILPKMNHMVFTLFFARNERKSFNLWCTKLVGQNLVGNGRWTMQCIVTDSAYEVDSEIVTHSIFWQKRWRRSSTQLPAAYFTSKKVSCLSLATPLYAYIYFQHRHRELRDGGSLVVLSLGRRADPLQTSGFELHRHWNKRACEALEALGVEHNPVDFVPPLALRSKEELVRGTSSWYRSEEFVFFLKGRFFIFNCNMLVNLKVTFRLPKFTNDGENDKNFLLCLFCIFTVYQIIFYAQNWDWNTD